MITVKTLREWLKRYPDDYHIYLSCSDEDATGKPLRGAIMCSAVDQDKNGVLLYTE